MISVTSKPQLSGCLVFLTRVHMCTQYEYVCTCVHSISVCAHEAGMILYCTHSGIHSGTPWLLLILAEYVYYVIQAAVCCDGMAV